MVADQHFVLCWPENLPLDSGAPLLCAGITTYSSLRTHGLDKPGTKMPRDRVPSRRPIVNRGQSRVSAPPLSGSYEEKLGGLNGGDLRKMDGG
ncbi:hypothetical protein AgCh_022138 [Apium graveolens]